MPLKSLENSDHHPLLYSVLMSSVLSMIFVGCSATPSQLQTNSASSSTNDSTNDSTDDFNPLGDLLSQAQSVLTKLEDPAPEAESITRFVIFTTSSLPQNEQTFESLISDHFKLTTQALIQHKVNSIAISKIIDRFSVTHLSTKEELPLNLEAFQASAQPRNIDLNKLQGLTVVSYQGRALRGGIQVKVSCQVTADLIDQQLLKTVAQPEVWVASLATLELLTPEEFKKRCTDSKEHWLRPGAELIEGGVRLVSRGLNQWGRPELELGPISRDEAPKQYQKFIKLMESVHTGEFPKQEVDGVKLTECLRPSHHYDTTCRRISL